MQVHHLERTLKRLKLSGILATLQERLEQAQRQQLGYLEFLTLLLEDEVDRRGQKALALRVARARFEEVKTLADFDFKANPKIPAAQIRDLATLRFLEHQESVLICGPVGVGKSHIAQALGYAACEKGYRVRYVKTPRLLADLGGGRADGTYEQRFRGYLAPDLLILDDFGLHAFSAPQSEDLYQLVCDRYLRRSTIVVSNRPPQDWYALFADPVLAEGALDRLVNASHHVLIEGPSYRPRKRPGQATPPKPAPAPDRSEEVTPAV
ncbi:MAG: IS21-like element helper ATPase IstB [Bacillota bacterium]|nr:IS21-like element helper ATPase IstB [Bacillota bacterium]